MLNLTSIIILSIAIFAEIAGGKICRDSYRKIGCFKRSPNVLQDLIVNDRDVTHANYSGHLIDWTDYYGTLLSLACRCYRKADSGNYKFFAIGFYGECFAGSNEKQYRDLTATSNKYTDSCIDGSFEVCNPYSHYECTGIAFTEFVYRLDTEEEELGEVE